MNMKPFFTGALAFVGLLTLSACSSNNTTSEDKWASYEADKTITIGFDNTFVPMGFDNTSGETVGFDIDLATAVFDQYGITVNWQPIDWDLKETELTNGNIDLIWNGYTATEERREKVLFSEAYMKNEQVLVTKKSSAITTVAGMKGKSLGVQAGSSGYSAFEAQAAVLKDLVKDQTAVQYSTFNEALIDLKNDRIDGLLIDRVYANYYLQQEDVLDDYSIFPAGFASEDFAVGARQADKTLIDKINTALKASYANGTFQEISQKWFGEDVATEDLKN